MIHKAPSFGVAINKRSNYAKIHSFVVPQENQRFRGGEIMTRVIISLIAIYALNIVDYFQTIYAVRLCGIGVEINPIGRFLLENNCGWVVKLIMVPIVLTIMGATIRKERAWSWTAYFLLVFYSGVVLSNFNMLFRIRAFWEESIMTTLCITLAVCAAISSMICGLLSALYKHAKKK